MPPELPSDAMLQLVSPGWQSLEDFAPEWRALRHDACAVDRSFHMLQATLSDSSMHAFMSLSKPNQNPALRADPQLQPATGTATAKPGCTQSTCSMLSLQVHTAEYVHHFNAGTLGEAAMRRIGFGEVTRQPILIERTKAEVAGRPTGPQSSGWYLAHCTWA